MAKISSKLNEIIEQIKSGYDPERIIVFGSYAYGKPGRYSDVDLLVIKKTKKKFMERLKKMATVIRSDLDADIIVYTPSEVKRLLKDETAFFSHEIIKKGKIVYERKSSD